MRRPRDLWARSFEAGGTCVVDQCGCEARVAWKSPTPRQYRRVAAWLRGGWRIGTNIWRRNRRAGDEQLRCWTVPEGN